MKQSKIQTGKQRSLLDKKWKYQYLGCSIRTKKVPPFEKKSQVPLQSVWCSDLSLCLCHLALRIAVCLLGDKDNAYHQLLPAVQDTSSSVLASLNNCSLQLCMEEREKPGSQCLHPRSLKSHRSDIAQAIRGLGNHQPSTWSSLVILMNPVFLYWISLS